MPIYSPHIYHITDSYEEPGYASFCHGTGQSYLFSTKKDRRQANA